MRLTRAAGLLFGGFVTLVGVMSFVGLVTDNFWLRLLAALLVVVAVPAFIADRVLRRTSLGGLSVVADVFAIVLLGMALAIASANVVTKPLLVREGDRYARSGSHSMARVAYFLAGVSPSFPESAEPSGKPAPSGSASVDAGPPK
jgi:hypothetical protein